MRDARGGTRWLQGRATPWRAKSAVQNYYNSTTFSYFGPSEPTLDLRLLQPPDLHHFLGNCPGRSQKFVAPHSEHAYFGTSAVFPAPGFLSCRVLESCLKTDIRIIFLDRTLASPLPLEHLFG